MNRVQPNARATLLTLVEAHIRNVLTEAISVSRHCKRARVYQPPSSSGGLNGEDDAEEEFEEETRGGGLIGGEDAGVDNTEAAAGAGRSQQHRRANSSEMARPVIKRRIHAADINMALQLMGSEKLYSTRAMPSLGGAHGENPSQSKVMLVDFLRDEPIGQPPSEVGIQQHWLAVDGVQPRIPQNPSSRDAPILAPPAVNVAPSAPGEADSGAGTGEALQVNQLQTSLLSEELLLYYTRVTRVLYLFDRPSQQDAVLLRLSTDPGLQELVPFLIRYCQHELYRAVAAPEWDKGRILVRLAHAMLQNDHLHLELHLHEVLPALVTCVVHQQPTDTDHPSSNSASMWALKREAADVLAEACRTFGAEYATLKSRILKALCRAMAADRHLTSRYGGIVGLSAFGTKAISAFLLPPAAVWFEDFDAALYDPSDPLTEADKFSVRMCQRAILDAVGAVLRGRADSIPVVEMRQLLEVTGDKWVALGSCSGDGYADCFI